MNTKNHTPESELIESPLGGYKIVNTDTWEDIAVVFDKDKLPLLAAAPEMLAVLKRLIDVHENATYKGQMFSAMAQARQIIDKAEGR